MSETITLRRPWSRLSGNLRDVTLLAKPRITVMVVFTTAAGMALAPGSIALPRATAVLLFTALLVASANALNSFIERDSDGRMHRTRTRPIPAGRLDAWSAAALGIGAASFAIPALALTAGPLTAALGLLAWTSYVLVYTPLKRITPWALEIGAVPGALPPLMGWTAVQDAIEPGGLALFGLLWAWQLPHFLAIALYLKEDYARGGIRVLPRVRGDAAARSRLIAYTGFLLAASLAAAPLAGVPYLATALVLGAGFLAVAAGAGWSRGIAPAARRVFLYSLVYLPIVLAALVLDSTR